MNRLVTDERARVGAWVAERVGREVPWTNDACLGWEVDGKLVAGAVYDTYVPNARASMHGAAIEGRRWLTREFLFAMFDYPFTCLDLKVLLNPVSSANADSLRFTKHLGFTEFGRFPQAWDGEDDLVLFHLRREDCRWLKLGVRHDR